MKISQEEIVSAINAYCNAYSPEPTVYPAGMRKAIEAALKVRRARKQAKRERQRKEKDKQVVESVKPAKPFTFWEYSAGDWTKLQVAYDKGEPVVTPYKASEWDGTFRAGEWQMKNGEKVTLIEVSDTIMKGRIGWDMQECYWYPSGNFRSNSYGSGNMGHAEIIPSYAIVGPWPKGEQ